MSIAIEQTIQVLQIVMQTVPMGTNLALLHLLWSMLQGSFLLSRGAIFPALKYSGFDEEESRRAWSGLRYGVWRINTLIMSWRTYVLAQNQWERHNYEGYHPVAVDWTAFWRFKLQGWVGKMFNGLANRALQGIGFGLVVDVGQVDDQRIPLLRQIMRSKKGDKSEAKLKADTLKWVAHHLTEEEVAIVDAGVQISDLQKTGVKQYVVRQAINCTVRRNQLPEYKGKGRRPTWGERLRPVARTWKNRLIAASEPDRVTQLLFEGREILVHSWQTLVLSTCKPNSTNETFAIFVFFDPLFKTPLVLATNLAVSAETVFKLYLDRWPVEQIPLAAKQMLGLHRQFVFAPESCYRLPELALLAGNILTYLATILPPMPTGFWDRHPKKHPVAYVVYWLSLIFQKITLFQTNFAKRHRSLTIYLKAFWLIDDKKELKNYVLVDFYSYLTIC